MKKIYLKLKELWKEETPKIAVFLQTLSGAIALIPTYYTALPDKFQATIPDSWLKYIAIAGGLCVFALQFTTKKKAAQ